MNLKVLITANKHPHYDRVGEIVQKEPDGRWRVRIPNKDGSTITLVREGQFKEVKREPDPPGTRSKDDRYQADGLGCVERVSSVERDWDGPRY